MRLSALDTLVLKVKFCQGKVEVYAIDSGEKLVKDSSVLLIASKVHRFLHRVPAQVIFICIPPDI